MRTAEIIAIGAVRIYRLRESDLAQGLLNDDANEAPDALHWQPAAGLPINWRLKCQSSATTASSGRCPSCQQQAKVDIDLRFDTLDARTGLAPADAYDAINDAVIGALVLIKLRQIRV